MTMSLSRAFRSCFPAGLSIPTLTCPAWVRVPRFRRFRRRSPGSSLGMTPGGSGPRQRFRAYFSPHTTHGGVPDGGDSGFESGYDGDEPAFNDCWSPNTVPNSPAAPAGSPYSFWSPRPRSTLLGSVQGLFRRAPNASPVDGLYKAHYEELLDDAGCPEYVDDARDSDFGATGALFSAQPRPDRGGPDVAALRALLVGDYLGKAEDPVYHPPPPLPPKALYSNDVVGTFQNL